jgi:hypothetical protein
VNLAQESDVGFKEDLSDLRVQVFMREAFFGYPCHKAVYSLGDVVQRVLFGRVPTKSSYGELGLEHCLSIVYEGCSYLIFITGTKVSE